jgi:hypothetical protein
MDVGEGNRRADQPADREPVVMVAVAIYPVYAFFQTLRDGVGWNTAYAALAAFGAVGVGFAFRQATKRTWVYLGLCMATAGLIGTVIPPMMVPVGIFLSIWWRRSHNLGVSGFTHAFIDSVRNAFGEIP